jgi:hypothetical protein
VTHEYAKQRIMKQLKLQEEDFASAPLFFWKAPNFLTSMVSEYCFSSFE